MLPLMRQIGSFLRFIFGCEALASILLTRPLMEAAQRMRGEADFVLVFDLVFCSVTGVTWFSLRKGWSSARAWSIAASLLNLFLFPIGTVIGIAGLMAFWQRN